MSKQSGYILILTLLIIGALFFFSTLIISLYTQERYIVQKEEKDITADEAARAGVEDAIYNLNEDPHWMAGFNNTKLTNSGATYSMTIIKTLTPTPVGTPYSISNYGNADPVTGWGGRVVPPYGFHIVSVGKFGNSVSIKQGVIVLGNYAFYDNFNNNNFSNDGSKTWDIAMGGKFDLKNGTVEVGPGQDNAAFAGDASWTDYTIQVTVTDTKPNNKNYGYRIFFRATGTSGDTFNAYSFEFLPNSFSYYKFTNGVIDKTPFVTQPNNFSGEWNGQEHVIKIEVKGNTFNTYADNQLILSGSDSSYSTGEMGIGTNNGGEATFNSVGVNTGSGGGTGTEGVNSRF